MQVMNETMTVTVETVEAKYSAGLKIDSAHSPEEMAEAISEEMAEGATVYFGRGDFPESSPWVAGKKALHPRGGVCLRVEYSSPESYRSTEWTFRGGFWDCIKVVESSEDSTTYWSLDEEVRLIREDSDLNRRREIALRALLPKEDPAPVKRIPRHTPRR